MNGGNLGIRNRLVQFRLQNFTALQGCTQPEAITARLWTLYATLLVLCVSISEFALAELDEEQDSPSSPELEELVVTADPVSLVSRSDQGSVTLVDTETISLVRASHPNEIFSRVPGVWVTRNSGQEHLTGIRSAVLAGAGACGAFLILEDNVPVRPVGFCNVNGLFELNTEQADAIEVLRGPASSLFGGNALHGVINVRSTLNSDSRSQVGVDVGPYGFVQARMDYHHDLSRIKLHSTRTNGFRDSTGYRQHKLNAQTKSVFGNWEATHSFAATALDQETGGYVRGFEAYRDSQLRTSNPNPEAFRNAKSFRMASHWTGEMGNGTVYMVPYARRSIMEFLQHFLPGQPLEKNSQASFGTIAHWSKTLNRYSVILGTQVEWMRAHLLQQQESDTRGSAFLVATRPRGIHYNFDVSSSSFAAFSNVIYTATERNELIKNVRLDYVKYDYDNQHLVGNTKDDGTLCGFGGCLYTRPADRSDDFTNVAVRFGYRRYLANDTNLWGVIGWGYRPPQTTELYRLQSGQSVADLKSERLRSFEGGIEAIRDNYVVRVAAYTETNKDLIFRDAEGMNVSDGGIQSRGVEFEAEWMANPQNSLALSGSLASHDYAFTRTVARGERIVDGSEVDSAPSVISSARWRYLPKPYSVLEIELNRIGSHYLNAENTATYDGHTLVHIRLNWRFDSNWHGSVRVTNALDTEYANRADYAFGNYRYFPGAPRQVYAGIELAW